MIDKKILMVDLVGQYEKIKDQINQNIINSSQKDIIDNVLNFFK